MIVREVAGSLWLIDQEEHGRVCGEVAAAWGAPPFAPPPGFLIEAAAIHDSGWREWDDSPRLDPETGWPHPYSRMPPQDYRRIWRRGLARAWARGPEVGLLVSLHGMRFFVRREEDADRELLAKERDRQRAALAILGFPAASPEDPSEPTATWHRWMFFWDALSLFLCEGWTSPWVQAIPTAPGEEESTLELQRIDGVLPGGELCLRPYPLVEFPDLDVSVRSIPARLYRSQSELDEAVAGAEHCMVRWSLTG